MLVSRQALNSPRQPLTQLNAAQLAISALTIVTLICVYLAWQHQCERDMSSARAQRPRLEPLRATVAGRWGLISSIRQSLRTALAQIAEVCCTQVSDE